MKKYKFTFIGVKRGAIGKRLQFTVTTEAENFEDAKLKLYDTHEHIQILKVNNKPVDKDYTFNEFKNLQEYGSNHTIKRQFRYCQF